jgi:putative FmdB family regulatory protein
MPMYEYHCNQCGALYDVLHKGREIPEDVKCPACRSNEYARLFSAPGIVVHGSRTMQCGKRSCAGENGCCGCNAEDK